MTTTGESLSMDEQLSILRDRYSAYPEITYSENGPDGTLMIPESRSSIIQGNGEDFPDNTWVEHWWYRYVFISLEADAPDGRHVLVVTNDDRGLAPGYDAYDRDQHLGCYPSVRMAMHVLERAHPEFHYISA